MIDIDRRKAILLTLLAPFAPYTVRAAGEQIAMLMYPGMTVLDLIGPQSMFGGLMGAKVFLVAKSLDPVTSDAGVTITPTATFETCPPGPYCPVHARWHGEHTGGGQRC